MQDRNSRWLAEKFRMFGEYSIKGWGRKSMQSINKSHPCIKRSDWHILWGYHLVYWLCPCAINLKHRTPSLYGYATPSVIWMTFGRSRDLGHQIDCSKFGPTNASIGSKLMIWWRSGTNPTSPFDRPASFFVFMFFVWLSLLASFHVLAHTENCMNRNLILSPTARCRPFVYMWV